jgi:hypothetical protein
MKKYMTPVTEIINLEASSMICGSKIQREGEISDVTDNPNQNPDWYQDDPIEDDDGELNSQSKSSMIWDEW